MFCLADESCPGAEKCCRHGAVRACTTPSKGTASPPHSDHGWCTGAWPHRGEASPQHGGLLGDPPQPSQSPVLWRKPGSCPLPIPALPHSRQHLGRTARGGHTRPQADTSAAQQCTPATARGEGQRGQRGRRCATGAVPTTASAEPARSAAPWAASGGAPRRCQVQAGPARCPAGGSVSPGPPALRLPRSPAHPGVCPRLPAGPCRVRCPNACSDDRGCPPEQKCCFTGCGLGCVTPLGSGSSDFPPPGEVDWSLSQAEETHRGDKGGVLGVPGPLVQRGRLRAPADGDCPGGRRGGRGGVHVAVGVLRDVPHRHLEGPHCMEPMQSLP